jgi:hypothetical protein
VRRRKAADALAQSAPLRAVQPQLMQRSRQRLHGFGDQIECDGASLVALNLDAVLELEHMRVAQLRTRPGLSQPGQLERARQALAWHAVEGVARACAPCAGA